MSLKPQDIFVVLKLCVDAAPRTYADLAHELGLSASEVHAAVGRLGSARLVDSETRQVRRGVLEPFLIHGVPFAFAVRPMEVTRGTATGLAASIFAGRLGQGRGLPPVWPDREGNTEGTAVEPLYRSVPRAARRDPALYALLALVDALRLEGPGRSGEIRDELSARLQNALAA